MPNPWSRILRGVADVAAGAADLIEQQKTPAAQSPSTEVVDGLDLTGLVDAAVADGVAATTGAPQTRDELEAKLAQMAREFAAAQAPGEAGGLHMTPSAEAEALPTAADVAAATDLDPHELPESPERHRQINEGRRRRILREDPINALEVAEYWLLHLSEQPLRAEEWTLCLEALPETAPERFNRALNMGMSSLTQYATFWDACYKALKDGEAKANQLRTLPEMEEHWDKLLDTDRFHRVLTFLGDRPDVEAIVQTERAAPTGDTRIGGEHIEGPPGSVQPSAQPDEAPADDVDTITGGIGPEVMSPADEAEVMNIVNAFDHEHEAAPDDAVDDRAEELAEEREEALEEAAAEEAPTP